MWWWGRRQRNDDGDRTRGCALISSIVHHDELKRVPAGREPVLHQHRRFGRLYCLSNLKDRHG